jgi:hypothetical protein
MRSKTSLEGGGSGALERITQTKLKRPRKAPEDDMKTGTDVKQTGVYLSECCELETEFSKDQTFTRCPHCSSLTQWQLLEVEMDLPMAA